MIVLCAFEVARSETPRWLNPVPGVLLDPTVLNSPDNTVGPGHGLSRHLAHRNITGLSFAFWGREGRHAEAT
jgi:hypothetical protein